MRSTRRDEVGAAAIEFALVLPLLIAIVLGAIDWGHYFYTQEIITNAAREGARAGSVDANATSYLGTAEGVATAYLDNMNLKAAGRSVTATAIAGASNAVRVTVTYPPASITGFTRPPLFPAARQAIAEMRR